MTLGEVLEKITNSNRVVVTNAARQVIYRGYVASMNMAKIDRQRKIHRIEIGMETYRKTDKMWDWARTEPLDEQIPAEQFSQFAVGELEHIIYIKIELENEFL